MKLENSEPKLRKMQFSWLKNITFSEFHPPYARDFKFTTPPLFTDFLDTPICTFICLLIVTEKFNSRVLERNSDPTISNIIFEMCGGGEEEVGLRLNTLYILNREEQTPM